MTNVFINPAIFTGEVEEVIVRTEHRVPGEASIRHLFREAAELAARSSSRGVDPFAEVLANPELAKILDERHLEKWQEMTTTQRECWLARQLWNDSSIVPASTCNDRDIPQGSTYAQAVRATPGGRACLIMDAYNSGELQKIAGLDK